MKPITTIICLLLSFATLFGQKDEEARVITMQGPHIVLTFSGMNLRAAPKTSAKVLAKVPMGAEVEVLSNGNHGHLTVDGIKGLWKKVKYGEHVGYMFNGYLFHPRDAAYGKTADTHIMNVPNQTFRWAPDYQWLGVYYWKGKFMLNEITPAIARDDFGMPVIKAKSENQPYLILACDKKTGEFKSDLLPLSFPAIADIQEEDYGKFWETTMMSKNEIKAGDLTFTSKGFMEKLKPEDSLKRYRVMVQPPREAPYWEFIDTQIPADDRYLMYAVYMVGDFNLDGVSDFILVGSNEKGMGKYLLFMSKLKQSKPLWHLSAEATSYGC
ncbi:MAG: SH3 domain-containing protein [Bacteroidota bacterium]